MRRLRRVARNQSWSTDPHHALVFARTAFNYGSAGLLYSISVPAAEMAEILNARVPRSSAQYTKGPPRSGNWTAMKDLGRLEIRPNRDRPDLKPKIVGTTMADKARGIRYGFTRRLERRRGVPTRGGGA